MIVAREGFADGPGDHAGELGVHGDVTVGFYEGTDYVKFLEEVVGPHVANLEGLAGGGFESTVGGIRGGVACGRDVVYLVLGVLRRMGVVGGVHALEINKVL